ncbi:MAG: cytochrome b N-terminal domain-containing protein [Armatimonadetes bacterium]|nr:cytochrome b N-terminal domain-containing protein [Armatimonadota bacterium]MDE2206649.1 cytochrome b N-terminal domain-containing protein [Armatimonadota bacterium]
MKRAAEWLDEHGGFVTIAKEELVKPMAPGIGWAHSLGNLTFMFLIVQITTGVALALNYAPTPDHAYASIQFIRHDVLFGSFLRSIHSYTASAVVIVVTLHMLRVIIWGAYKNPRELTWLIGVFLLLLIAGFAFTGYLLPWDQRAYWATTVGTALARSVPLVGGIAMRLLRGGGNVGAMTLMRFYTAHTMLFPALLVPFVGLHLFLVRKMGSAGTWKPHHGKGDAFFPKQAFRDIMVAVGAFSVVIALAILKPVGLAARADPTNASFVPRPEWYFLSLYQGLKYLPGSLEVVGVVVIPAVLGLALLLLPWLDRGPERDPRRRVRVLAPTGAVLLVVVVLTGIALTSEQQSLASGASGAAAALPKAAPGLSAQALAGLKVYAAQNCSGCHSIGGKGGQVGPALDAVGSRETEAWLESQVANPTGHNPKTTMPAFKLSASDLKSLGTYLATLKGASK